jgi:hypothetical protein
MWKIVIGFILVMARMHAQNYQDLLLPQSRHIAGTVFDQEGKPIVKARIDHSNDRLHSYQTDSGGRFELDTRAPILVIRKAGFQSALVRTQDVMEARVTLQKLSKNRLFPACSNTGQYDGLVGWGTSFQFRRTAGIKVSRQGHDIDYGVRNYYVMTKQGPKGIMHGSGPNWTYGTPEDRDVWRSVKYDEVTYDAGGFTIIDARGQLANGKLWRSLEKFGESASYSDMDEETAKILDKFLDGACLKPASHR